MSLTVRYPSIVATYELSMLLKFLWNRNQNNNRNCLLSCWLDKLCTALVTKAPFRVQVPSPWTFFSLCIVHLYFTRSLNKLFCNSENYLVFHVPKPQLPTVAFFFFPSMKPSFEVLTQADGLACRCIVVDLLLIPTTMVW